MKFSKVYLIKYLSLIFSYLYSISLKLTLLKVLKCLHAIFRRLVSPFFILTTHTEDCRLTLTLFPLMFTFGGPKV